MTSDKLREKFVSLKGKDLEDFKRTAPLHEVMAYADWELANGAIERAKGLKERNVAPMVRITTPVARYYDPKGNPIKGGGVVHMDSKMLDSQQSAGKR